MVAYDIFGKISLKVVIVSLEEDDWTKVLEEDCWSKVLEEDCWSKVFEVLMFQRYMH